MEIVDTILTKEEIEKIKDLDTETAAIEICTIFLQNKYGKEKVEIVKGGEGADLKIIVTHEGRKEEFEIEVKGTEANDIAFSQLKVSSKQSYERLKAGLPLYRVTGVKKDSPKIFIMKYGLDFDMSSEPRWSVHPWKKGE